VKVQITEWSVGTIGGDAYDPPEVLDKRVQGCVKGHPRKPDGTFVVTSPIRRVDGRRIVTRSGTEYELVGDPAPDYLEYLERIGRKYDPEAPIAFIGAKPTKRPDLRVVR
jgi:hypothetical protein